MIDLYPGENRPLRIRLRAPNAAGALAEEDLTGATVEVCLVDVGVTARVLPVVTATVVDAARGLVEAQWTGEQTAAVVPGRYLLDCRRTDGGRVRCYDRDTVEVGRARPPAAP